MVAIQSSSYLHGHIILPKGPYPAYEWQIGTFWEDTLHVEGAKWQETSLKLIGPREISIKSEKNNFQANFSDWWLWYLKQNCPQMNITEP